MKMKMLIFRSPLMLPQNACGGYRKPLNRYNHRMHWFALGRGRYPRSVDWICALDKESQVFLVSWKRGFLPVKDPLKTFMGPPEWQAWEETASDLPKLVQTYELRQRIASLPCLCPQLVMEESTEEEAWRMMSVVSFISHAYVWGGRGGVNRLPRSLAAPWCQLSERLEVPPIMCYASYVLYNWRCLDPGKPLELGNIKCLHSFSGCEDEEWFIAVHVSIEAESRRAIKAMLEAWEAGSKGDVAKVGETLEDVANSIQEMRKTLHRMHEGCDPAVYYNKIRKFLCGWRNNSVIPEGLLYDNERKFFYGASGAQSSILPALDSFLGIRHDSGPLFPYLQEMRRYMPPSHRLFLKEIESENCFSLRRFALGHREKVGKSYDECVKELFRFRWRHMELATTFASPPREESILEGTGGTHAMRFLRQNAATTMNYLIGYIDVGIN